MMMPARTAIDTLAPFLNKTSIASTLFPLGGVVQRPRALRIPRVRLRLALREEPLHHHPVPALARDVERGPPHHVAGSVHDGHVPAGVRTAVGCERRVDERRRQCDVARGDRVLQRRRHDGRDLQV